MTTPTTNDTWTIGRLLAWTTNYFTQNGVGEPRLTAEVLLAHALNRPRIELYTRFEESLESAPLARFRSLVKRAADHEPFAYLVGEKEFYSLPFHVTPAVLIPRPETETLVDAVVEACAAESWEAPTILDFGTGSGCVAVAIVKQLSAARVIATDVSPEALEIARRNANRHGVADRISFVEADSLDFPEGTIPPGGIDVLVSNPPYVAQQDMPTLERNVQAFEPNMALTDGGNGLSFFKCMADGAPELVRRGGYVIVEVGDGQARPVIDILNGEGELSFVKTIKDQVTRHERVVVFRRNA